MSVVFREKGMGLTNKNENMMHPKNRYFVTSNFIDIHSSISSHLSKISFVQGVVVNIVIAVDISEI